MNQPSAVFSIWLFVLALAVTGLGLGGAELSAGTFSQQVQVKAGPVECLGWAAPLMGGLLCDPLGGRLCTLCKEHAYRACPWEKGVCFRSEHHGGTSSPGKLRTTLASPGGSGMER